MFQKVTSKNYGHVKHALALRKKSMRDQEGMFTIEGVKELVLAVNNGVRLHSLFIHEECVLKGDSSYVLTKSREVMSDLNLCLVSDSVYRSMSYRASSEMVAIGYKHDVKLEEFQVPKEACIVICSALEKPGNLGAVMRSADAVGAEAVIIENPVLDVFNPNVVRASIGTLFTTPVVITDFDTLIHWLREKRFEVIATSPGAATNYTGYSYARKVAIVVGNEAHGLQRRWFDHATAVVSIPQFGQADSLNTATSATVILYEILRQRAVSIKNSS